MNGLAALVQDLLRSSAVTFAVAALLFVPLERAFPARAEQPLLRPRFGLDLRFFLGQQLCFGYLILAALTSMHAHASELPLAWLRAGFARQALALRVIEAVMAGDLLAYWGHRLQHRWAPMWRLHAVHHSAEHLDWLAAFREHPLDGLYTQALLNLPLILTGFTLHEASGIVVFRGAWAIFIHSNVRIPLGPLAWLFGAPQLHHWHHENARETCNFGNLSPWTDLLFGTHRNPPAEPPALGLERPMTPRYVVMLLEPMLIRARRGRPASGAG